MRRITHILFALPIILLATSSPVASQPVAAAGPSVVATIPVGTFNLGVAVNPTTNRVYVTDQTENVVHVIRDDGATQSVVGTFNLGGGPGGIAVDHAVNKVYVAYSDAVNGPGVGVLDGSADTGSVTDVPIAWAQLGVGVNSVSHRAYVGTAVNGINHDYLAVVQGESVVSHVPMNPLPYPVYAPTGIAVDSARDMVYVADSNSVVVAVNGATDQFVDQIAGIGVNTSAASNLAINPSTNLLYAVGIASTNGYLSKLDFSTNPGKLVQQVQIGEGPNGVAVNPTTNHVFVTDTTGISVYDGATLQPIPNARWTSYRGFGIAVNPATNRVYIAAGTDVLVIDDSPTTYSISGHVTDAYNNLVSGVTVSDGSGHTALTDDSGYYKIDSLAAGSYLLTPSKTGGSFNPPVLSVTVSSDVTGQDFITGPVTNFLTSPLRGVSPYSAQITSVFDHSGVGAYKPDRAVQAYTGELGSRKAYPAWPGSSLSGYAQDAKATQAFFVNGNYGGDPTTYLFYDGHPGIDFGNVPFGTPVYAAASGTIKYPPSVTGEGSGSASHILELDPDGYSDYRIYYLHLSTYPGYGSPTTVTDSTPGCPTSVTLPLPATDPVTGKPTHVTAGCLIALSGDYAYGKPKGTAPHLHFEVQRVVPISQVTKAASKVFPCVDNQANACVPVDPYGWDAGTDPKNVDPYIANVGVANVRLWSHTPVVDAVSVSAVGGNSYTLTISGAGFGGGMTDCIIQQASSYSSSVCKTPISTPQSQSSTTLIFQESLNPGTYFVGIGVPDNSGGAKLQSNWKKLVVQ